MQEGGEEGRDILHRLGLPGVDFHPPGLRGLTVEEGGGRTDQRLRCIEGFVTPDNRSRASLREGP